MSEGFEVGDRVRAAAGMQANTTEEIEAKDEMHPFHRTMRRVNFS